MSYYRKKPVIIEARQYVGTASQTHDVYLWVEENTLGSFEPLDVITGRVPCPASGVSIDPRDGAEAPPLERDRVAAILGLVADPALQLNPAGLKRHRQRAGLTPSQVTAMLAARGWDITQRDIFRWENQSSADVPPAVIEALAQVVRATTEDLTSITTP